MEKSTIDTVASNNVRQFTPLSIAKSRYPGLVTKLFSAYQSCNRLLLATCASRMPDHTVVATRRESIITIITFLDFSGLKRTVKKSWIGPIRRNNWGRVNTSNRPIIICTTIICVFLVLSTALHNQTKVVIQRTKSDIVRPSVNAHLCHEITGPTSEYAKTSMARTRPSWPPNNLFIAVLTIRPRQTL